MQNKIWSENLLIYEKQEQFLLVEVVGGAGRAGDGGKGPLLACGCGGGWPGFMNNKQGLACWFNVAGILFQGF